MLYMVYVNTWSTRQQAGHPGQWDRVVGKDPKESAVKSLGELIQYQSEGGVGDIDQPVGQEGYGGHAYHLQDHDWKGQGEPQAVLRLMADKAGLRTRGATGVFNIRGTIEKLDISHRVVITWNSLPDNMRGWE